MNQNIFNKFSDSLKKVLVSAEKMAYEQKCELNTEHLILAILATGDNLGAELMAGLNITPERISLISSLFARKKMPTVLPSLSTDAKEAISSSFRIALKYNHNQVDCEHLLFALLQNKKYNSYLIFERLGVKPAEISSQIISIFENSSSAKSQPNLLDNMVSGAEDDLSVDANFIPPLGPMHGNPTLQKTQRESLLSVFATNLCELSRKNILDPVIGREEETDRIIQILSRRTKNNPILVGEPGVGKTAIVEGLARRIVEAKVPPRLLNNEILSLDMGAIIAGTMYRGQFESRMKKIISEVKKRGKIILFIDEIHTVVGAGSTEGSVDAANILKPLLSKGELRLIGSTTFDEYKKYIEKDAAFERRLQPVKISEPTEQETIKILEGVISRYEKHHNVSYSKESINAAAYLSKRYINDRFLPDKAIDLIDEAGAATNTFSKQAAKLSKLKNNLREILRQKDDLIMTEKYREATLLREKEIVIEKQMTQLESELKKKNVKKNISADDIASIVSRWTGIPVKSMTLDEKKQYLSLEKRIKRKIIGQDQAVKVVVDAIKRARVGISNPTRPTGSFIFLGPTGVGKTELAKVLSEEVLGNRKNLIKIDMSEFMEKHNVSRLVGAPAGYVGYEEGGKLTETIRKNPYAVILLDEIEKAHPEVFNILLQIMEDGELTDAKGRRIDFKNTIIIMTSNLGTDMLNKQSTIGFEGGLNDFGKYTKIEEDVMEAIEKHFRPEFLNRLDNIVIFHPLSPRSIKKIVELNLGEFKERLEQNKYKIIFSIDLPQHIAEIGFDQNFGARPIRKIIANKIEAPFSQNILLGNYKPGDTIKIDIKNDQIVLSK